MGSPLKFPARNWNEAKAAGLRYRLEISVQIVCGGWNRYRESRHTSTLPHLKAKEPFLESIPPAFNGVWQ
jgi:hypothetical protein